MSTISFPLDNMSSSSQENQFYSSSFDASSSFQMNPLSQHPPRTPRPSVVSTSSHLYGSPIYQKQPEQTASEPVASDDGDELEEAKVVKGASKVSKGEVWRDMFLTSNGRDKAFKLIQYSIRMFLLFHTSLARSKALKRPTSSSWETELVKRLESTASGFSFTRKLLLLFNWLTPLTTIAAQQTQPIPYVSYTSSPSATRAKRTFLQAALQAPPPVLLELVHAIADDVTTLGLVGLLGKKTGERAGRFSDWCWLIATLVGLVENGVEKNMIGGLQKEVESRLYSESMSGVTEKSKSVKASKIDEKELSRLQREDHWLQVTRAKLLCDLIFVSYDIFKIKRAKTSVKTFTGLTAAILSSAKLYDRHKSTLAKASLR